MAILSVTKIDQAQHKRIFKVLKPRVSSWKVAKNQRETSRKKLSFAARKVDFFATLGLSHDNRTQYKRTCKVIKPKFESEIISQREASKKAFPSMK